MMGWCVMMILVLRSKCQIVTKLHKDDDEKILNNSKIRGFDEPSTDVFENSSGQSVHW